MGQSARGSKGHARSLGTSHDVRIDSLINGNPRRLMGHPLLAVSFMETVLALAIVSP